MKTVYTYTGALTLVLGMVSGCFPPQAADDYIKIGWVCDETGADPEAPCDVDITGSEGVITDVLVQNTAVLNSLTINEYVRETDIYGSMDIINIGGYSTLNINHGNLDPIVSELNASGTSLTRLNMGRFEAISMVDSSGICMADYITANSQVIGPVTLSDNAVFVMNNGYFPLDGEAPVELYMSGNSRANFWGFNFSLVEAGLGGCTWDVEPDGVNHSPAQEFTATGGSCQITGISKEFKEISFIVTLADDATLKLISAPTLLQDCFIN